MQAYNLMPAFFELYLGKFIPYLYAEDTNRVSCCTEDTDIKDGNIEDEDIEDADEDIEDADIEDVTIEDVFIAHGTIVLYATYSIVKYAQKTLVNFRK